MKKFLALCCCLFLWLPSLAQAFPNEPEGFRGLKWGAPFPVETNLRDKQWQWDQINYVAPGHWYKRYDPRRFTGGFEKETLGSFPIRTIYYLFSEDKFVAVYVSFQAKINPEELLKDLTLLWGEPSEQKEEGDYRNYFWKGRQSHIVLHFGLTKDKKISPDNISLDLAEAAYEAKTPNYHDLTEEERKLIALKNDL